MSYLFDLSHHTVHGFFRQEYWRFTIPSSTIPNILITFEGLHMYLNVTPPTHTETPQCLQSRPESSALVSITSRQLPFHMHEGVAQFYEL